MQKIMLLDNIWVLYDRLGLYWELSGWAPRAGTLSLLFSPGAHGSRGVQVSLQVSIVKRE
jgi:hypothetical protein